MGETRREIAPGITLGANVKKLQTKLSISGMIYNVLGFLSVVLMITGTTLFFMKLLQASLIIVSTCLLINLIKMLFKEGKLKIKIMNLLLTAAIIMLIVANMKFE